MIKKITIEAISIKKTKADGTPYVYAEKDKKTKVATGKTLPRTMVSIKSGEDWYMGWSYKDGSSAEQLKKGDVVEVLLTEDNGFKNWKFPKQEDKDKALIEELQAKLASATAQPVATVYTENPVALDKQPF